MWNNNRPLTKVFIRITIRKLKRDEHKIFIITALDSEFYDDPDLLRKNWLDVLEQGIKVIITEKPSYNTDIIDLNSRSKIYEFIGELE